MKKSSVRTLEGRKARSGILFSLPFIIGFFFFYLTPFLRSVYYSFCQVSSSVQGMTLINIGLANFNNALTVKVEFRNALIDTLSNLVSISFPIIMYSFFIAMILNQKFKGRTLVRVIFFLPVLLNCGIMYFNMNDIFTNAINSRMAGNTFENSTTSINLTSAILNYIPFANSTLYGIISGIISRMYSIVTTSGVQILIYLAGLQSIPASLYEASSIEGATAWENFWKITFPILSPLILVNSIYTIIDTMTGLQNPVIYHIYYLMKQSGDYGLASAMSSIYLSISLLILAVVYFAVNRMVFYEND